MIEVHILAKTVARRPAADRQRSEDRKAQEAPQKCSNTGSSVGEYTGHALPQHTVGSSETWFGPFDTYEAAMAEWSKHAWQTVDDCHTRYRIESIDKDTPPPCTD